MPENVQGQFEKRLYLNTRIKSGGTYTTEGPHGLAFVEELNNYVTENQNTSITLGSSDHKVSILFDGPSTFVRDGIGISSSVPASTSNKLYNNNGDLYWNGSKITYKYVEENLPNRLHLGAGRYKPADIVLSASDSIVFEGPEGRMSFTYDTEIFSYNDVFINADYIHLNYSTLVVGPENDVTFNATTSFNALSSFSKQGLTIRSNTTAPSVTFNKLYNYKGDLYWNGTKLNEESTTFNFIEEGEDWLRLGLSAEDVSISGSRSVLIDGPQESILMNDNGILCYGFSDTSISFNNFQSFIIDGPGHSNLIIGPDGIKIASNKSIIINGPDSAQITLKTNGIHLGDASNPCTTTIEGPSVFKNTLKLDSLSSHPSDRTYKLYNKDGDLYWGYNKLFQTIGYINEDAGGAYIGKLNDSDFCQYVEINADEVTINDTRIVVGPSKISLNAPEVKINDTSIVSGANEVSLNAYEVKINDTVVVAGPSDVRFYNSLIIVGPNGVTFNATTSFDGPVTFNGTAAFNGPISSGLQLDNYIPSSTSNRLYNNNGDLYWNGSKVGGGGSSYEHIVEVPDSLYLGWKGDAGTEIDRIETRGEYIETYFDTLLYDGNSNGTVSFDYIESFVINGPGDSNLVIGPDGIKIASNGTITINGPNASQILLGRDGIHLGSASTTCTTTIEGPSIFKNTLKLDSLSSHPSNRTYKLYNNNGDLYWNGTKLNDGGYLYIYDDAGGLHLGKLFDSDYCQYVEIKADEVKINDTVLVIGPGGISMTSNNSIFISGPKESIFISGPNAAQLTFAYDGIHLGSESNPCTITIEGPSHFKNTLELDSLSSHPSVRNNKLYNKNGDLYWSYYKLAPGTYIDEDAMGLYLGKIDDSQYCDVSITADEVKINGTSIVSGPNNVRIYDSTFIVGPGLIKSEVHEIQIGSIGGIAPTTLINGPVVMSDLLYLRDTSSLTIGPSDSEILRNYKGNLYWDHSKVTNSIIEVPYQDVANEPGKHGSSLTLENNTIYNFDPDHDVDISNINVKPWNTPQLHLYFNNTSSGKSKMTFTYPSEWKWINQSTPPSSSDFKEGYLYCIALRSVANPVYSQSSTTPPYNQQYIVIANIAYEVPVDV